ncbi:MAG: nucleoside hydrolase [Candidatus Borkfalkiaceae bacterium]|nr:nucleoside hydrolase [Clostridia bacterium]MDY6222560.1 nucleoside hydrolase [Christensenellaceae bacterium]
MIEKYIIDTDIGDDIDDAFALEYAVNAGLDIIGVTTVFRNAYLRAKLSAYLLRLCGKKVPVYAGEDLPLVQAVDAIQKADRYLQPQELAKVMREGKGWLPEYLPRARRSKVSKERAVDFLIDSAKRNGERLGILAIGPLTNLARAFQKDFESMRKIGGVYLMGGNVSQDTAEWNIRLDPEAADIVFRANVPVFLIGSDMTWKHCMVSNEELCNIKQSEGAVAKANRAMLELWENQPLYRGRMPCMHDSLVVATVVCPACVSYKKMFVRIGLCGAERGKTIAGAGAPINVACKVNETLFRRSMWKNIFSEK